MKYTYYKFLVMSDLYRLEGRVSLSFLLKKLFLDEGAYKYIFWMRTCRFLSDKQGFFKYFIYFLVRFVLRRLKYKMGISIPYGTDIKEGFYIGHMGGIVVNEYSRVGRNCNISHGVTIGQSNRGKKKGYPTVGDNVYIGPGAKIIGSIIVGNNSAIGSNCVVTRDVPDYAVVVGVPAKIISYEGSTGYVNRTDYEEA